MSVSSLFLLTGLIFTSQKPVSKRRAYSFTPLLGAGGFSVLSSVLFALLFVQGVKRDPRSLLLFMCVRHSNITHQEGHFFLHTNGGVPWLSHS